MTGLAGDQVDRLVLDVYAHGSLDPARRRAVGPYRTVLMVLLYLRHNLSQTLLAELFEALPEAGDLDKPKLAFFFDEAHLLFDDASKAFLTSVAQTVRLIRSKGVGVYFITQTPKDVPSEILGQLGNRVQHALRAFTPDDAKALKATVSTFPKSPFYDVETLLTSMGIGEALARLRSRPPAPKGSE